MFARLLLLSLLALPARSLPAQSTVQAPLASGYITSIESNGSFALNGVPVHLAPDVAYGVKVQDRTLLGGPPIAPFVGQFVTLEGRRDKRSGTIDATTVTVVSPTPGAVAGYAIIDSIPPSPASPPGDRILRADGYLLHLTPRSAVTLTPPLAHLEDLRTNLWIEYHGTQQVDGSVLVDRAAVHANLVRTSEEKLRDKNEFSPSVVTSDDEQGFWSKGFRGLDPKRVPALKDPILQARIDRIGQSLIPAYQRGLQVNDPTRIDFRFQLVDLPKVRSPLTLPSGIVLVPAEVVDRLGDDSQLAAILANNIAEAIEKDTLRAQPVKNAAGVAAIAGYGAGLFVPGVSIATDIAGGSAVAHVLKLQRQQRARVSLCLLQDAGYDLRQAPVAWWLLASKEPRPIEKISMPEKAAYLYQVLGTTFRPAYDAATRAPHAKRASPRGSPDLPANSPTQAPEAEGSPRP